jgi:hypothetical protein
VATASDLRLRNYLHLAQGAPETAFRLFIFDLHLRALIIKAMAVLETELQILLGVIQTDKRFVSFGTLRKKVFNRPIEKRQKIAEALGCNNSKELAAVLLQFNEVRNLSAHHSRLWNRKLHFSIPKRIAQQVALNCGKPVSNNSAAACLGAIKLILNCCPCYLDIDEELETLLSSSPLNRSFLLMNMGFAMS